MKREILDRDSRRTGARRFLTAGSIATAILILAAFSTLISLGNWQVRRLHWKEGLLAKIAERMHAPAIALSQVEARNAAGKDIEYTHLTVGGTFDNSRERHFLATFHGSSGFFVYTPLRTDGGEVLFVNRGFVPYDLKSPAKRPDSLPKGHVVLTGLARDAPPEKPSSMVPDNDVAGNIFYWKDLKTMASSTGLSGARLVPFFVDADRMPGPPRLPIGGVTVVDLPNDHLQYAITWYGLALVLVLVTGTAVWRRLRRPGEDAAGEDRS